ncbi:MAG TPA: DUF721 domain-containing protein [Capillibacterium sp.]
MNEVTSLAQIIKGFLKDWSRNSPVQTGLAAYYWPQVIGEALKEKTEVSQVKNGILWIKTPDPALAYNLTFFKKEIINKYRRYLGKKSIQNVRITVGALSLVDGKAQKREKNKESPPALQISLPAEIASIHDPELKQAFTSFYYAHERWRKRP